MADQKTPILNLDTLAIPPELITLGDQTIELRHPEALSPVEMNLVLRYLREIDELEQRPDPDTDDIDRYKAMVSIVLSRIAPQAVDLELNQKQKAAIVGAFLELWRKTLGTTGAEMKAESAETAEAKKTTGAPRRRGLPASTQAPLQKAG